MTTFGNAWYEDIAGVRAHLQVFPGRVQGTYWGDVPLGHPYHAAFAKRADEILSADGPLIVSEVLDSKIDGTPRSGRK